MAKRRTSRKKRPSARRRTSRRPVRRRSRRRKRIYLYYRTPKGMRKLKDLGPGAGGAARAAYKNWCAKVRGKGYRTLRMIEALTLAEARKKAGINTRPKKRRSSRRR